MEQMDKILQRFNIAKNERERIIFDLPREDLYKIISSIGRYISGNKFILDSENDEIYEIMLRYFTANKLFEEISEHVINKGGIIDRPYGVWKKMIYSKIPEYMKLLKEVKKILDPHDIFNPGKIIPKEGAY